jgi:hypothetical protein
MSSTLSEAGARTEDIKFAVPVSLRPHAPAEHLGASGWSGMRTHAHFLIGGQLRIQVKGSPWVELVGWSHGSDTEHASMSYDLLVFVDIVY